MRNWDELKAGIRQSPAFIVDFDQVAANLRPLEAIRQTSGCKVLYSVKALPLAGLLADLVGRVDGFSASSLFEAKLAADVAAGNGSLHLTTPGLRSDEFPALAALCSHISFNSLSQMDRLAGLAQGCSMGLRLNPKLSFADDLRYDPCRPHSKLGVAVDELANGLPAGIEGLHLHTVFGQTDYRPLFASLDKLAPLMARSGRLHWLNLGGGYLYHRIAEQRPLIERIADLRERVAEQIYLEPGKALVGNAGFLLCSVLDSFVSDGKTVLVLDTSVNHHPEVFEYQRRPQLLEENPSGKASAILAGCSCLAGDLFGEYRFDRLPKIGEKLVFADVGAYSLIKANRFNGYALPSVYRLQQGALHGLWQDDYAHYRQCWQV